MANKFNKTEEEYEYVFPYYHFKFWKRENGELVSEATDEIEISEEMFTLMYAAYKSGKYKYLNEVKELQEYVDGMQDFGRAVYANEEDRDIDDNEEIVFDFPEEIKAEKPLTREEIAYYKGEGYVECEDDDYKYVKDVDSIVNLAQYDIFNRLQKRPSYMFDNDAEYRLYLVLLYDYAMLDEM
ncbi:MAG: hypothetical protein J6040_07715 [Clostridiales bacterium]|nr:hypothetical protein [Clostridiales bacterium]